MTTTARRCRLIAALGLGALAAGVIGSPAATAHATVTKTSPRNGVVLKALPASIAITFNEAIIRATSVRVVDARRADHTLRAGLDPRNAARLLVRTRGSATGRVRVTWSIVSADGHRQTGTFAFRVAKGR
jgi:methionine-rich copper-binding protein CopC